MNNTDIKNGINLNTIFLLIAIISFVFTAGVNYGGVAGYKEEVEEIKRDYARRDVLDVRLSNIERSLIEIKESLREKGER